ncbi:flagellar protein FlaG [Uliginosibacterium sp. H3]|uniref:Flagellar protein FlaG n=1 Tax=Uliginosibacterium silvisoli TaxID=3114758 RepID=A0ABU6KA17_9RHOO|nr:flagellar protein FlaG [Uliginosibacterium sp. H3]
MAIQPVGPYVPPTTPVSPATAVSREASTNQAEEPAPKAAELAANTQPSREQLDKAVGEVKKALAPVARNLQFSIDDETGRSVVRVIDASTNEVIRQFPSEELLAITRSIDKLSGLFVKQKA